jgi:RecA-family ATPase
MTADVDVLGIDDNFQFGEAWRALSPAEQSAIGARGLDRFRKLTSYIDHGRDTIERAQAKVDALEKRPKTENHEWPASLDLEVLAELEPELPQFIIGDWLPVGYATLLAGHGGVGKSAIALHLAVCCAAGVPFFGLEVARRRVIFLSCEDRRPVLHWRLSRICLHIGVDLASLRGWLEIIDLVGADAILWERDLRTGYTITPAFGRLQERMADHQTEVLMVDGISDTFAGNENARGEVKRFVNGLVALIPADTGAVLLVGHVSKPGSTAGANGEGYSGSTGWHNSARARWYLYPEAVQGEDGERAERTGDLILELQKSNLGRTDQSMRFIWDEQAHLFIGSRVGGEMAFDRKHRDREEQEGILRALRACATSNPQIVVPAATTGRRTAHHVLSAGAEFPETLRAGKPAVRRFWRQVEALRAMGAVNVAEHRMPDRHYITQFVLTTEGMRACGQ